jgi:integrase
MFWMEKLHGLSLRAGRPGSVDLGRHITPALTGPDGLRVPSYRQRIVVLKTLYSWLRTVVHRLQPAEDPTFGRLKAPQSKSAQGEDDWKVIPVKDVLKVAKKLGDPDKKEEDQPRWPDMIRFLLATGWHVTELNRFMVDGSLEPVPDEGEQKPEIAGAGVVVCKRAKRGNKLKTRVSEEALEIAKRLAGSGGFSVSIFYKEIAAACKAAKVTPFHPGNMRHTVATYAQNHGAPDAAIASFLNHAVDAAVVVKFYSRGVALKVPTPL